MSFADWSNEKKKKKQEQLQSINTQAVLGDKTSFSDWSDKKAVSRVDYDYVNSFVKSATDFLSTAEKEYSSVGWDNAYNIYRTRVSSYNDLNVQARNISEWFKSNADKIDSDTYNTYNTFLDEYNKSSANVIEAFKSSKDMFSQFESEEAYKTAKRQNDINNMSADDIKLHIAGGENIAYTTADGKNVTWQSLYDKKVKEQEAQALFSSLSGKSDFNDAVKAATAYKNPAIKDAEKGKAVVNKVTYFEENANMIGMGEANGGGSNIVSFSMSKMTDQEKAIYNYYFGIGAYEQADAYLDSLEDDLQERFEAQLVENMTVFAQESPVIASAVSVGTNLFSAAEALRNAFDYAATGELNRNHSADLTNAIRGAVADQVDWEIGNWDAFDFLYNTGMSGLDSLTAGYLLGPVAGVSLGLSAAAQGVNDALDRGMTNKQAFFNGLAMGVFEALFETVSISNLNALKEVPANTVKDLAKNIAKSMLVNASEEALTEIANITYDSLLNGDFSAFETSVRQYMDAGMSESEARAKARGEFIAQVVESAASGAVMGAGFGVIGSAAGTANTNAIMKDTYGGSASELVTEALEINPDNKYAQKVQTKLEGGKSATSNQLRKLVYQNETAMKAQDVASIKSAAAERLTTLGETGDIAAISAALAKQTAGERLTANEKQLIEGSKYGQRVANELNAENINSGEYSSAWAEKIGTNRINPEEYGRLLTEDENVTDNNVGDKPERVKQTVQEPAPASQDFAPEAETVVADENTTVAESAAESKFEAPEAVSEEAEESETVTLEAASAKYGAQATAMVHTYTEGQDVAKFDVAYGRAYDMGKSGVALSYVMNSEATSYLTEAQRELAYEAGKAAAGSAAVEQDAKNKQAVNGKTGRRIGVVKGEGVSISDLKKSFNDTQNTAYKVLSTYAEATGIDIVLYKSEAGADGRFEGAQGKFKWSEDTIYIDINAGLADIKSVNDLAKYAMLRTFAHEFTHFIEKWNPVQYNEFRRLVFDTLTERGENVHDLIEEKQAKTEGMSYDAASREVVAEAMTDILPDANFVQELAEKHKTIFDKLLDKLHEFVADLKKYFASIGHNRSREANALREQVGESVKYVESIVKLFDRVAAEAVENYQRTVAVEQEKISEKPRLDTDTTQSSDTIVDNNTDGGIENAESVDTGRNTDDQETSSGTREETGDRSGIPEMVGEATEGLQENRTGERLHRGGVTSEKDLYKSEDFIKPKQGTALYDLQKKAHDEYGLKLHVIKESAWNREDPAIAFRGEIYVVENIEEDMLNEVIPHEATHAMRLLKFQPYLDFIERTPDSLIFQSQEAVDLMDIIKDHVGINYLDMTDYQRGVFYDELNSSVYGFEKGGVIYDSNYDYGWIPSAFHDFDAYINELTGIHEQFKQQNAPQKAAETTADAFTITDNQEYGTLEIKFDGKPSEAVRDVLKANKFRWHGKKGIWYGKAERVDIINALREAYNAETVGETTETVGETVETKEVNESAENVDNGQTVLGSDADGQGASRLLDEPQETDVRGASPERDSVGDTGQRESETERHGDRVDADAGDSRSEGSGESRDIRRDELTEQEAEEKSEHLNETVEREIEQKSTEKPKGSNFVIGDSLNLPEGEKAKYRANVDAIRLIKQLESEGRYATTSEQELLSKYVGWGGLDKAFGELRFNRETRRSEMTAKDGWEKEFAELRALIDEGIITEQEYKDMSASTKNAHYTSIEVIKAMYDGLKQLGFTGGRMLEPSSGTGNFVGAMPADMSAKVNSWTMVELDRITGLIAKYLYPNADMRIQGFETANIPDNYMDVAIGNVPFGSFGVVDRAYPKRITKSIHNYFFAKSLDKVRPGGIVMFITSSFTMNGNDTTVRQYIMERADLLGAIRLPNTAFKGNAGTEVVTDILILKKRESGTEYAGEDFLAADYDSNYGTYTSNYFKNHPEMVLGKPVTKRGMYGASTLTFEPFTDRGTIDEQIREAFKNIKGKMSYPTKPSPEKANFAVEKAGKKAKSGGFVVHSDGSISRNENGQLVKYDTDEKTAKRIAGILSIRDAYKTLANYLQQGQDAKYIKQARTALNKAYDSFVKEYGVINSPANRKAIDQDPDQYAILSLENYDAKKKTAKKADIFTKDTISANKTVTHVDSIDAGVIASINLTGGVDTSLIAKLTDKTVEDVTRDIIDARLAFKTRDGELIARESYLSGNVRAKLREAEALAPYDADFNNNVEELRKVIPADIPYNEIYITPGNAFIPNEVYADFIAHMLGGRNTISSYSSPDVEVGRTASGDFKIVVNNKRLKNSYYNTQTWGTARKSFLDLIDAMMGSRTVKVTDMVENDEGKKIAVLNEAETEAANEKVKAIQKEFEDWIWQDEDRRTALARLYNETFNAIVNPKYDGSHISVNGINADYSLREHQANAVHRIIASGGNTLLAHRVGAGKTLEMAAAAMKLRELGVIKKPVFVVPKSVVAQWGVEFHSYFPAARLLVADDKSFTPANRKIFTNKIANGDYDAVIVSYEQFEKIPMSAEYQARFYEDQINEIIAAIAEEKAESRDGKGLTVKEMEKKKAQLEKKLKELTSKPKDENNVEFEMLGIDSLFVDEAHNFKNLEYVSKMTNVAGLGSAKGSQRAFDLFTKIRYLQGLNGGRGIVFATATPVMNSMVELYIMQRYLQPDVLDQLGIKTFDAWAKQFGEVVNKWEINPSGTGMRQKQVFANFRNLNELQLLFRSFADVLTDVPGLKIPKMKGGAVKIVECEPGQFQKNYMQELQKRAENVKNVDPSVDNMLKITSDGRKVSYTQRMIDPSLPYEPGSKIFRAADNVLAEYRDSADIKGTQIVFLDMATPKGSDKSKTETDENATATDDSFDEESARLYDDMRAYLVKGGIPKKEIAFIHEADSDAKRKQLFEDVNNGKVRVLMGSTGKMGVGMNAQKRVVAIHHLDAPWRPGDVEQRDGRAFRQKNINEEVSKYVYVTKGSFDSRLWDILDRKQHFINQIMNGEDVGRTAEDTGEVTLSAAEVKALASGNPLIEEQTKLTDAIKKLENLQKAYNSSIRLAKTKLADDEQKIAQYTNRISRIREDIKARVDTYSEGKFSMTVGKQVFTDKKDAGAALAAEILAKAGKDAYVTVATFAGFELRVIRDGAEFGGIIHGKESYKFNVYMTNTTRMVNHIGEIIAGFENMIKYSEQLITETTADRDAQQRIIAQPFEKQDELIEKRARFNEVMELLAPKTEQQLGNESDTVQEQSREYLGEQEQQRTDTLTDREVLAYAAEKVNVANLTDGERDALNIFKDRLSKLDILEQERAEQGRLYKEQQFGAKPDRAAAAETLNRMHTLDGQIQKASADVLSVEDKKVLKTVLQKARKVVELEERQHGQEILNRWRDRRNNAAAIKKYRDRLKKDVDDLSGWVLNPNNKDIVKHIPDALKNSVVPFLSSINFMSKRSLNGGAATKADEAFMDRLKKLNKALKSNIDLNGLYSGYNDLPPNFMERLQTFINSTEELVKKNSGELVINLMTSEELKELSQVVRTLKKYIMQFNRFHYNAMYQHVYEAGEDSIAHLKALGNAGNTSAVSKFLLWDQIRPAYAFERFGKGGEAIYDGLRRGQAKLAFNTKEIQTFTEKAYTEKEVKAWENEIKTFSLGKDLVKMPVSYIMAFYELSKDPEALEHINGEGIRVATYKHKGQKISDTGHILTVGEFNQIIGSLTDRQREVADSLQKYMAEQGGKWGNYVSVARFGEELFTNKKYFPINSDGRHLQANADEHPSAASLYALLNMSFTKSRKEGANNRIVIYSIFDVFANHMASMAQYNAMALPILDALKWFNYQQVFIDDDGNKHIGDNVRERMDRAYGVPEETKPGSGRRGYAQDFVMNIIKAFNGTEAQGTPYDSLGLKSMHRYNVAQVAYNLRVVIQQPLAITRAAMLLDYGSILRGLKLSPKDINNNIKEMQEHSGIAAWKSLGFYDVNISRGLTHLIKHDSNALDKIIDVGMWGAEKADLLTWAAIWSACKEEVIKKQLAEKDGFYEAVTKLFEDVIYKTQVVDSVLTKNEFMRDKGAFARLVGSFMSEPTANASMLIDAYDKYARDIQSGMTKSVAWQKNGKMISRRLYVYAVGALLLAAVQALADAPRDDDDYEEWYEKWFGAFGGNLVDELLPFNKLPIMSDFYDLAKELLSIVGVDTYGNPPQSVFMQWYDSLVKGTKIIYQKISGEDTNYTYYGGISKLLQAVSGMTGLPMSSATREFITAWNNTVGAMAPSLKVKTYDPGEMSEIKYAYADGYLTAEEAMAQLLDMGLVDNENEAYFTVQGWEAGEGYSRYDAVYDAVRNGGNIREAMAELISHGYTEEQVISQIKGKVGEWYRDGEISKSQATVMLQKYTGMDSDEITETVNKWSSKVVTGINYDDIDDEFMAGNITASRAKQMYMLYGGMTKEKASEKVAVLEFVKKHPLMEDISYSAVESYTKYCEPYGVSAQVFYGAWKQKNNLSGDVKESMMKYINSLNLSARQKDSLYYAFGWAESKIYEAPWR